MVVYARFWKDEIYFSNTDWHDILDLMASYPAELLCKIEDAGPSSRMNVFIAAITSPYVRALRDFGLHLSWIRVQIYRCRREFDKMSAPGLRQECGCLDVRETIAYDDFDYTEIFRF